MLCARLKVLNPLGTPPPIRRLRLAPRLPTIEGKTIYVVDVKYPATKPFFQELLSLLATRYARTKWVIREKVGTYFEDDPSLWEEIKRDGDAMIIGIGH
jgi:hypothetical protein